jgi:hypothetical protein
LFAVQAEQRIASEVALRLEDIGPDRATWPAAAREEVIRLTSYEL